VSFLLECSLRAAIIVSIGLGVLRIMRRASAATRHSFLATAMLCAAVLPILIVAAPEWNLEVPAGVGETYGLSRVIPPRLAPEEHGSRTTSQSSPPSQEHMFPMALPPLPFKDGNQAPNLMEYIEMVWAAGAIAVLACLVLGWARLAWIASKADPVQHGDWLRITEGIVRKDQLHRRIRLLHSHDPAILATWGILRPKIVLPRDAHQWNEERIQVVLRHELAHVRRHDWFIQMLSELLRAVYWFNPLLWITCARLRRESEQAADDTVLNSGVEGSDYAAHLLDLARTFRKPRYSWTPALLMARESTLEHRFKALLNPDLNRRALTRVAIATSAVLFLGITLPVAALRVSAQEVLSLELPVHVFSAPLVELTQAILPQTAEPASVEGFAVQLESGEPLAEVHVELNAPADQSNSRIAKTGRNGQFAFQNVSPGDYRIVAAREGGYLPAEYGQRTPMGRGLTIQLSAGQKMTGIRISLAQPGSISGRVSDGDGEPVGRAQVQALRTVYLDGQRSESVIASVATDDRGEYRLYWLPPGQYRVSATPQDIRRGWVPVIAKTLASPVTLYTLLSPPVITRRVLDNGEIQEETQVPTYFPATADFEAASTIDVRAGAGVTGVDITVVPPARTHHIRGVLISASTARPVANGLVRATSLSDIGNPVGASAQSDRDGRFEISGVLPDRYVVVGTARSDQNMSLPIGALEFGGDLAGSVSVTVGANDLENVSLAVSTGFDVPVKVTIEGRLSNGGGISFRLRGVPGRSFIEGFMPMRPGTPQWNLLTTSKFTIEGVKPGDYKFAFFSMGGDPRAGLPVYVKSIRMGATDVLNGLLRIAGPVEQPLEIVLSANTSTLEGAVVDDKGEPVPNVSVAVIPDAPDRMRADLYKAATTDASGRFHILGVAPGDYRVFSWQDAEGRPWQDSEWLRPYEGRGRPVHLGEGSEENVRLTVIR
jgi:beta-lactamase regulating signal transducer with metallopeptidase domain